MPSEPRSGPRPAGEDAGSSPPQAAARAGRARALRNLLRAALGLVVLVLLALTAVLIGLQTDWGRERVRRLALQQLRGMVHGRLEVGRLGGDFVHGIVLEGVAITGPAGEPFFGVKRLELTYDLLGFLRKQILVDDLKLLEPRVTLVQDPDGEWNVFSILPVLRPATPSAPEQPGGWGSTLRVERLQITNGAASATTLVPDRGFGTLGKRLDVERLYATAGVDIRPLDSGRPEAGTRQSFDVEDVSGELRQAGLVVREIAAKGVLTPRGLELERLRLRSAGSELAARGTIGDPTAPDVDLEVKASPLSLAEVRRLAPRVPPTGRVTGSLRLRGPADSLTVTLDDVALATDRSRLTLAGTVTAAAHALAVDARLVLDPLDPEDARSLYPAYPLDAPARGELTARGSRERVDLRGELAFDATRATVAGTAGLPADEPVYDVTMTVTGLDPADLLGEPRYGGVVNGELRATGEGRRATLAASLRDSRLMGYAIVSATLDGRLARDAFALDSLRVALPRSVVRASGSIPFGRPIDVRFEATSHDLGDLRPGGSALPAGRFEARGRVSGPLARLEARLEVSADSLAAPGAVLGSVAVTATLEGLGSPAPVGSAEATISDLRSSAGPSIETLELTGRYAGGSAELSASAVVDSLRKAEAQVTADLRGASPRVVLDRLRLARGDQTWTLDPAGRLVYQQGVLAFEDFTIEGAGRIGLDGTLTLAGRQDLRFSVEDLALADLQRLAGRDPAATGILSASGSLAGTARAPLLESRLKLEAARAGRLAIRRFGGRIDYADRRLTLDLELEPEPPPGDASAPDAAPGGASPSDTSATAFTARGAILLEGSVPLDLAFTGAPRRFPDEPLDLRLQSRDLSPASFGGLARRPDSREPPPLAPIELDVALTGRPSAPLLDGRFSMGESRVGGVAVRALTGTLGYAERRLTLDATLVPEAAAAESAGPTAPAASLSLRADAPLDLTLGPVERRIPEGPLDVRLESSGLTLAALEALSPRIVDAAGPVEIGVSLTGTPAEPRYAGRIAVTNGTFRYGSGGPRYSAITGSIEFDNDRVSIPDLRVSSKGGEARLAGSIALRDLTLGDVEARLRADDFTLLDQDGRTLVADADLRVAGTTSQPTVAGSLTVERFEWPIPERTDKDVIDLNQAVFYVGAEGEAATPSPPPPDLFSEATLDVDVAITHDAVLRNDKTLIALQGDLSIDKARGAALPSIAGALRVTRGFYADFGKRFEVTRGEVRFYGTAELDPALDVAAVTTVKDNESGQEVQIVVEVGGTASAPALDLTSSPAYDRSEIVSLLLFGTRTPGQGQEGEFQDTVARLAASQAGAPLTRALSAELGLDLLEIQPGLGASGGGGIRAGKYISPDVFLTYEQGMGPLQETQIGIQYRLSRNWTLGTQVGQRQGRSQAGVDVFYEFQY